MNQPLKLIILIPTPPRARLTSTLPWSPLPCTFLDWNQAALCETAVSVERAARLAELLQHSILLYPEKHRFHVCRVNVHTLIGARVGFRK